MLPKISIIMPVYNAARFIRAAIDSVLSQTYANWELLIVNNNSVDESEEIIKLYSDQRIRYFVEIKQGVSYARNLGLQTMTGTYFCFLDADDQLTANSLMSRYRVFEQNPELDYVDGVVLVKDENLDKIIRKFTPGTRGNPLSKLVRLSDSTFFGPSWLVKRKDRIYRMREELSHCEDIFFYIELSASGGKLDFTEDTIMLHRTWIHSAMSDIDGLGRSYHSVFKLLKQMPEVNRYDRLVFYTRVKRIMFLSYLVAGRWSDAIGTLVK
jgi:glycosyltransferase involved in cell wall biosynthesis